MVYGNEYEQCESCRYFLQHYIKRGTSFHDTRCGHCINRQLNSNKLKRKYDLQKNCEYWESNEEVKKERRELIKDTLRNMEKYLSEMLLILKEDEK